jgi:hypothetical protein
MPSRGIKNKRKPAGHDADGLLLEALLVGGDDGIDLVSVSPGNRA